MAARRTLFCMMLLGSLLGGLAEVPVRAAGGGALLLRVRDARTGAALAAWAKVRARGQTSNAIAVPTGGTATAIPADSEASLAVASPGHAALTSHFRLETGQELPVTFWLPSSGPEQPAPCLPEGRGLVRGWLYDSLSLRPLEGAMVYLEGGAEVAVTGNNGAFELPCAALPPDPDGHPPLGVLVLKARGYSTLRVTGLVLTGDIVTLVEDLEPGAGVRENDLTPMALRGGEDQLVHQSARAENSNIAPAPAAEPGQTAPESTIHMDLVGMTPPASIRLGTACSCTSCSSVSVYALEDYVARGLDNEWISSWASHSLKAGSIPYRSYGAWYTYHPLNANYDICSNACCQAFDSAEYTASQTAANATAGFMLQEGGALFRAEYSAENNCLQGSLSCTNTDLSCGDGYAGSPANNWPCLSDSVCAGQSCYGHGRGECQWGTQRWASNQAKLWNWISNHYYNNAGSGSGSRSAYLTSPITMPSFSPSPSTVAQGGTFTINVTANDSAGLGHSQIMIGASLYSAASGWISDPAHDAKVSLSVGSNSVSRLFTVPAGTAPGLYDLVVALWYDVDGDNAITGSDLALLTSTASGAVTVVNCSSDSTFDWKADFYSGTAFNTYIFSKSTARPGGPGSWSDWGTNSPYPGCVPVDQFSVRWTKSASFAAGTIRFLAGSDDGARLYVDGAKVLDAWVDRAYTENTTDVPLTAGSHTIVMEYYDDTGTAVARLDWWYLPVAVPNGASVGGQPLAASRSNVSGSTIHLAWGACASAANYAVYYGDLASVSSYSFTGGSCSLGTAGAADWTNVPWGNLFFLVAANDGRGDEGSWGVNSQGGERGGAAASGLCGNTAKITGLTCQ